MAQSGKSFGNIIWHGEVNGAGRVVPVESDAAEELAFVVDGDVVVLAKGVDEMRSVSVANNFDAKVIYHKVEYGWSCGVAEEAWGVSSGMIAVVGKVFYEFDVCEASSLGKTVHTGSDFDKDASVVDEGLKLVFLHDVSWNGPGGYP